MASRARAGSPKWLPRRLPWRRRYRHAIRCKIDPQQQFADTSDANSPEVQATQQQVANTPQGAAQPRFKSALDPRSARVAFDKSRGVMQEEKMFVKSYNNTYTLKKSLNENIEEKWNEGYEQTIDEAFSAEQAKIYDEFLTDFGKCLKNQKIK